MSTPSNDPVFAAFEMADLTAKQRAAARPWLPFLETSTMQAGLYVLPTGGIDEQHPHEQDELYYVASGRGVLQVEGEDMPVGPGSLVYVKARAAHRFHSINEELRVLVIFSGKERG